VTAGTNATFSATASNATSAQWQVSTNGGGSWTNTTDGAAYSGSTNFSSGASTLTVLAATPAMSTYQYRVVFTGATSPPATSNAATLTVTVPPLLTTLAIASETLTAGAAAAFTPVTSSGGYGTVTYALSGGTLPTGLSFSTTTGQISGTPTTLLGATNFTVTATDSTTPTAQTSSKTFSLTVAPPALTTTQAVPTTTLTAGTAATAFTPVTASGGYGAIAYALSGGTLPTGLTFSTTTGQIGGTPTTLLATTTFTVTATDSTTPTAQTSSKTFSLTVAPPALTTTQAVPTTTLTAGTAATAFTPVTASGGYGTITYALSGGTLPTGLTFSTTTGQIGGTPTTLLATTTFTVTATDSTTPTAQTSSKTFSLTVAAPALTTTQAVPTTTLTAGTAATAFTPVTASGGYGTITYALSGGTLPTGLTFSTTTGQIGGTPTTLLATTTFTVTATDSTTPTAQTSSKTFQLTVGAATLITNQAVPTTTLTAGTAATAFTPVTASGGYGTISYALSGGTLPTGLTFSTATGQIGGTPTNLSATTTFTVTATDSTTPTAQTSSKTFQLTVGAATLITNQAVPTTTLTAGTAATAFTPVTASGGYGTITYALSGGTLPTGLTFSTTTGQIGGTPTTLLATTIFTVTATDSTTPTAQISSKTFQLTVGATTLTTVQAVPTKTLTIGTAATPFTPITASGGFGTITYALSGGPLPTGLTFSTTTGQIGGTPTTLLATTTFTVTATDSTTPTAQISSKTFQLTVGATNLTTVQAVPTKTLTVGTAATPFIPVTASGGFGTITYALSGGPLPTGLTFSTTTGQISGTPTTLLATTTFTVTATDSTTPTAQTSSKTFQLTVGAVALTTVQAVPSTSLTVGTAATSFTPVTASGGYGTITYALSGGTLPTGLTFSTTTGQISGTPTTLLATTTFTVTATDSTTPTAQTSSKTFQLTVAGAPTATLSNLSPSTGALSPGFSAATTSYTDSVANSVTAITLTPTATDPNATVKINGVTVSSGAASGSLALAVGTTTITTVVTAQNGANTQTYTLAVTRAMGAPVAGAVSATVAYGSSANSLAASLSGGAATSLAISTAPIHGKATVSGTGFSYTPASGYFGQDSFAYTAANTSGTSAPATVSVTVSPPAAPTVAAVSANVTYNSSGTSVSLSPSGVYTSLTLASQPAHGTATLSGATAVYTPTTGFSGADSFTYTATGPGGTSTPVAVSLTVAVPPPPTATAQQVTVSVSPSVAATGAATTINLASAVTNATGLLIVTPPAHGKATVTGFTILYMPNIGYFGTDSFTYAAVGMPGSGTGGGSTALLTFKAGPAGIGQGTTSWGDGGLALGVGSGVGVNASAATSAAATVTITIPPPTLVMTPASLPAVTSSSYSQALSVSGGTAPYTFAISAGALPAGMTLSSAGVLSGAPTAAGTFAFTVKATDSSTGTGPFSVAQAYSLTTSLPAPVAQPIAATVLAGQALSLNVTQNAAGAPFTAVAITTPPAKGAATINGQAIVYTAPTTLSGTVTFSYTLSNAFGTSAPALVTLTVNPLPIAAGAITVKVSANTPATADITHDASGGPFTGAALISLSPANAGTAVIVVTSGAPGVNATYGLKFTPGLHFSGSATATYTLSNAYATSGQGVVIFQVAARPDPSQDPDVRALLTAQRDTALRFAQAQMSNFNQRLESLHTEAGAATTNGVQVSLGDGPQSDMPGDAERRRAATETAKLFAGNYPCQRPGQAPEAYAACPSGYASNTDPNRLSGARPGPGGGVSGLPGYSPLGLVKTSLDANAPDASSRLAVNDTAMGGPGGAGAPGAEANTSGLSDKLSIWTGGAIDLGLRHTTSFATGPQTPGSANAGSTPGSQSTGFKFTTAGVSMGADYRLDNKLTLGAGVGYGDDTTKIGTDGTRDQAQSYLGVLYGDYRIDGHSFIDALLGYGDLQFQTRRFSSSFDEMESGRRSGGEVFGALTYSFLFSNGPWSVSPYGRLGGVQGTLNAFTENGGFGALSYASQTIQSLTTTLGVHGEYNLKTSFGLVAPKVRLEYQREFEGAGAFDLQYADWLSGPTYGGSAAPQGHDTIVFGLGADVLLQSLKFSFQYKLDADADAYQIVNELTGKVDYKF
jgi:hypothetical protein